MEGLMEDYFSFPDSFMLNIRYDEQVAPCTDTTTAVKREIQSGHEA